MDAFTTYRCSFSAAHQTVSGHSPDGLVHGHEWTVEMETASEYDQSLETAVGMLLPEFGGKDLGKMIARPDGLGLAAHLLERFALTYPRLVRVTVHEGSHLSSTVRREPRRTT